MHMFCPICKADLVAGGLKATYLNSTAKILERIKKVARAYDKVKRPDLFICHSFKDRRFTEKLAIDIREAILQATAGKRTAPLVVGPANSRRRLSPA